MNITTKIVEKYSTDSKIFFLFEDALTDASLLESAEKKAVKAIIKSKDFEGKNGETLLLYLEEKRLFLVGLGKKEEMTIRTWKHAVGTVAMVAQKKKITACSF